jgi:hypothetical protein
MELGVEGDLGLVLKLIDEAGQRRGGVDPVVLDRVGDGAQLPCSTG